MPKSLGKVHNVLYCDVINLDNFPDGTSSGGRMFIRTKKRAGKIYLQLVENRWVDGRTKQRMLKSLGRLDVLRSTGQLDALLRSGIKFSERLAVLDAHDAGRSITTKTSKIGPALIFEKLWAASGLPEILRKLLSERQFEFSVERAIFITVLHRLMVPGSDRACEKWKKDYKIEGGEDIRLHHFYRAMGWLGSRLRESEQLGASPFSLRCVKDIIEEDLFRRRQDLFSELDLVFSTRPRFILKEKAGRRSASGGIPKITGRT